MEITSLFSLPADAVAAVLASVEDTNADGSLPLVTFDGFPTAMLFRPNEQFTGSLHYMFFPAEATQAFHYHPTSRYLLVLGDVDLTVLHSPSGPDANPNAHAIRAVIPAYSLTILRFPGQYWHSFRTAQPSGRGVMAFTFHENDEVADVSNVRDTLMEQETTFWQAAE